MEQAPTLDPKRRRRALAVLLLVTPVPLIGTTTAMVLFPDAAWAKALFAAAKVAILLVPLVWLWRVERVRPRLPRWRGFPWGEGMAAAHITGVVIFIAILAAYFLVGERWIDTATMLEKIEQMGFDKKAVYLAGAVYWCTANSLLEEYFWRWFVYLRLREVLPRTAVGAGVAVVVCGLLFTAHHVVALSVYFDARTTILASLGVFIGGVTWSWIYGKYRNIYAAYVSHVWADLAIFGIGWHLIFGA
ncbi:MAG: CPBP family glutamic-type intramembrane protease [Planctomycetota bacterium]